MILGIDPGPSTFAAVWWNGQRIRALDEEMKVAEFVAALATRPTLVAIEDFITYRVTDLPGRETIKQIGALRYVCEREKVACVEISRRAVLAHFIGPTTGGDTALRAAIYDRFGGSRKAAIGTKKNPGPLYGLTGSHLLAALAVAITAEEKPG